MEQDLARLDLLWTLLRAILEVLVTATFLLILLAIPMSWWMTLIPISALGVVSAFLGMKDRKIIWIWATLLAQAFLFASAISATIFGYTDEGSVPVLLLAFTMILLGEQAMTTALSYGAQFSNQGELSIREFNVKALTGSLNNLYRRLAGDGLILGSGFVLSVAAASLGAVSPNYYLSDPSLYIVIASISLAALLTLKEE